MQTIVFIGDSVTQGSFLVAADGTVLNGLPDAQRFSRLIGTAKGYPTIINAGKSGDTVDKLRARLATDVIPYAPCHVVVMIGINNVVATYPTPVASFKTSLAGVGSDLQGAGCTVSLMTPNLVRISAIGVSMPPYLEAIADVGLQSGVPVLPVYDLFCRKYMAVTAAEWNALFYDEKHPSAAGHAFIASMATSGAYAGVIPAAS